MARAPRKPRIPRLVSVVSIERVAPRWMSMTFKGDALEGFHVDAPTAHVKLFLPAEGERRPPEMTNGADGRLYWPDGATPPSIRTYTPRRFDAQRLTLDVQLLLHGDGPASRWAEQARLGDQVVVVGPGGRFALDGAARRWWIAGDESALPAIGTLLETLPAGAGAEVHVELADDGDRLALPERPNTDVAWHVRRSPTAFGAELADAARAAAVSAETRYWVACEATAMRAIRRILIEERGIAKTSVVTRGYWRIGETAYRDGDYGED